MDAQREFEFCRERPGRKKPPEALAFALMPEEASAAALARLTETFLAGGRPLAAGRLHVALRWLAAGGEAAVYGAKLAGRAVAAAGLTLSFDAIGSLTPAPHGDRVLALTGFDTRLSAIAEGLDRAMMAHGLRPRMVVPHIALAVGGDVVPVEAIVPVAVAISGLALLRGDPGRTGEFQVLRRWPLNMARAQGRGLG